MIKIVINLVKLFKLVEFLKEYIFLTLRLTFSHFEVMFVESGLAETVLNLSSENILH